MYYQQFQLVDAFRTFFCQYVDPFGSNQGFTEAWYTDARSKRQSAIQDSGYKELPEAFNDAIAGYPQDLTEFNGACRNRGVKPILVTQPTLYSTELSLELESLLWMTIQTPATAASVMDAYNQ